MDVEVILKYLFVVQFVLETWRVMKEKDLDMNNRCCMFVMQALTKGGYLQEVYELLFVYFKQIFLSFNLPYALICLTIFCLLKDVYEGLWYE